MNPERLRDRFFAGVSRYRWLETLGRGGVGVVFKAQDLELEEIVAIKVLSPDLELDEQELLARFKREINLNRKIKHPNVARIHDFGTSGDFPYITMEFVPGRDLWTLIRQEGRLSQTRAISILRQIALGTHAAHRLDIIHRDLKSQNVIVDDAGAVAILDFGLARNKLSENRTLDSVILGTPHYMSPEQALGKPTDARSDIYSIGVIAFECLTGHVPFTGDSPIAIGLKHITEPIPRDLDGVPALSLELKSIVLRALAKNPDNRYQNAADLEAELEAELALGQLSATATPPPQPAVVVPAVPAVSSPFDKTPLVLRTGRPKKPHLPPLPEPPANPPSAPGPPLAEPVPAAPPKTVARHRAPGVLVVSPEYLERKRCTAFLGRLGWKVQEASTGQEALEVLIKKPADLVLMDVKLPGMDGFDVTRILRSQPELASLAVVLLAPQVDRSAFAFGIQSGATDCLPRGLNATGLGLRLWKILRHRGFAVPETEGAVIEALKV